MIKLLLGIKVGLNHVYSSDFATSNVGSTCISHFFLDFAMPFFTKDFENFLEKSFRLLKNCLSYIFLDFG